MELWKIALMRLYINGQLEPVLTLPGEEVGSPKIYVDKERLFISYHTCKNGKSSIQLAEVDIAN